MVLVLYCPKKKPWFDFLTHGSILDLSTVCSEGACAVIISCCLSGPWHIRLSCDNNILSETSACPLGHKGLEDNLLAFMCDTEGCHADCSCMRVPLLSHTAFLQGCHASHRFMSLVRGPGIPHIFVCWFKEQFQLLMKYFMDFFVWETSVRTG